MGGTSAEFEARAFSRANAAVGSSLEDIGEEIVLKDYANTLRIQVTNGGATALSNFVLLTKAHVNGAWVTEISGSTWGTVAGTLKKFVGALNTLAGGASGAAYVDIGPVYAIKFQAMTGGADTPVTVSGQIAR